MSWIISEKFFTSSKVLHFEKFNRTLLQPSDKQYFILFVKFSVLLGGIVTIKSILSLQNIFPNRFFLPKKTLIFSYYTRTTRASQNFNYFFNFFRLFAFYFQFEIFFPQIVIRIQTNLRSI